MRQTHALPTVVLAVLLAVLVVASGVLAPVSVLAAFDGSASSERPATADSSTVVREAATVDRTVARELTGCTVVSAPGRYELVGDIDCLRVRSDDVVVDGDGFAVRDTDTDLGEGVFVDNRNVTLRNLTVAGFETGIHVDGNARAVTLDSVTLRDNGAGADIFDGEGMRIVDSTFANNTVAVLGGTDFGLTLDVERSTFVDNGDGISVAFTGLGVTDSVFERNGVAIECRLFCSLRATGNDFVTNDVGVSVASDRTAAVVLDSRIADNRVGVRVGEGFEQSVTLRNNTIAGNTEFGVLNEVPTGPFSSPVDARENFWGDPSGPSSATVTEPFADPVTGRPANGQGDAVSEDPEVPGRSNVRFDPFVGDGGPSPETFYQVDFVGGDVIERLGPADSDNFYSDQGRLVRFLHGSSEESVTRDVGGLATLDEDLRECVGGDGFEVDDGTVTIRFTIRDGCSVQLSLVSYEKPGPVFSREAAHQQVLVDSVTETFGPGTYELTVELPVREER